MGKRVLVIEDEPNIVEAIRFILSRDGWDVTTHGGGADAMEVLRACAPDVVILDVMLPVRNGLDILADIRADATLTGTPVLMLTARGQAGDRETALEAGASGYIIKPFANTDILEAVRRMVAP